MPNKKNKVLVSFIEQQLVLLLTLFPIISIVIQRTPGISFIAIIFYLYFGGIVLLQIIMRGVKNIKIEKPQRYFYLFALQVVVYFFFYRTTYLADLIPLLLFFATAITFSFAVTKKNIHSVMNGIVIVYFIVLIFALFEFLVGIYFFSPSQYFMSQHTLKFFHVPVVTFHNTNNLASFFLLTTPFIVARFKRVKSLLAIVSVMTYVIIIACQSTIGMVVYPLYFAYVIGWHKNVKHLLIHQRNKKVSLEKSLFVGTAIAAFFTALYPYLMKIPMIYVRVNVFLLYFNAGLTHVVLGSGFGASIRLAAHNWMHLPPHNFFLFLMYDYGALGLFLVCASLYFALTQLRKNHFHTNKYVHSLYETALLFILIVNIIPSGIYTESMTWLMFGLLLATTSPFYTADTKEDQNNIQKDTNEILVTAKTNGETRKQYSAVIASEPDMKRSRKSRSRTNKRRVR